jgi:ankyrin repeat protein
MRKLVVDISKISTSKYVKFPLSMDKMIIRQLLSNLFGIMPMTIPQQKTLARLPKNPAANDGGTPLHLAAEKGHLETVKLLLEHAKDKNPADNIGSTPLHWAAQKGHLETVKFLLEHAKDKNPANKHGMTPLHC